MTKTRSAPPVPTVGLEYTKEQDETQKLKVFIEKLIAWDNQQREREDMASLLAEMTHDDYRDDVMV